MNSDWVHVSNEAEVLSILVFSFNTESVRLCGTLNGERKCDVADFWPEFSQIIAQVNPAVVAIGFQEDVRPGSFFHSDLLPKEMQNMQYSLFERANLMGMGKTTVTGLKSGELFRRGLRLSVYLRNDTIDDVVKEYSHDSYHNSIFKNKGAVAIYITLPNRTRLALINMHLPFNAASLIESTQKEDRYIRMNAVATQNIFLNNAYRKLVFENPAQPHYTIVMGDLNYRMIPFDNWSARETGEAILANPEQYRQHDELTIEMQGGDIYPLNEGVGNVGPTFAPTCKMRKGRNIEDGIQLEDYNLGKHDARVPSYCDRILYQTYGAVPEMVCLLYDRFDEGMMNKSDHAGVYGLYSFA